ncbi:MAG: ATP-binding cassette domain-containing protein [Actinomycetota bacterium]|nr:ATP-binding cassette domain-containing protein [Actinomycetota bacterium]
MRTSASLERANDDGSSRAARVAETLLSRLSTVGGIVDKAPEPSEPHARYAIRIEGLSKIYADGTIAVHQLDLTVRAGEIFGLLGPNGAGKTTTVGMLTTRVVPTAGKAVVGGIDVVARPAEARQVIGVVSQSNTLDRGLNVWENLYFHGRYFGMGAKEARTAADRWLEAFRLSHKAYVDVAALSGGMTRRLMLARSMLHGPQVVFLDEPTAGLDPQSRRALWEMIRELHASGRTILLTTHYMEEADQLCERVAIMDHGEILALDTPVGLKRSLGAGASLTVGAEGDLDRLAAYLGAIEGATDARRLDGCVRLHLDTPEGALAKVIAAAERGRFRLTDVSVSEATLETVFMNLTGEELRE